MQARAVAHPNIALIKYWGKRNRALNLPSVGSISITLDTLAADTQVIFDDAFKADEFILNGVHDGAGATRVSRFLDLFRQRAGVRCAARVTSDNNFPTGAGLASSAAGFAALARAVDAALGLDLDRRTLSILARRGSGSAGRSLLGGFVEQHKGEGVDDDADAFCEPLLPAADWPLRVVVAITATGAKATSSTDGMSRSAETSPYFSSWVDAQGQDLEQARAAIVARDFTALAALAEFSCMKMHGLAMGSRPPLMYFNGATVDCMNAIVALRAEGVPVFFTVDAGPQVKAICAPDCAGVVAERLSRVAGVKTTRCCGLGCGARVVE